MGAASNTSLGKRGVGASACRLAGSEEEAGSEKHLTVAPNSHINHTYDYTRPRNAAQFQVLWPPVDVETEAEVVHPFASHHHPPVPSPLLLPTQIPIVWCSDLQKFQ